MDKISVKIWIVVVAIFGYSLTGLLYQNLQTAKSQNIESIVSSTSEHYRKILQAKLASLFREMEIAKHLYQNSNIVDINTFRIVAQPMVERSNGLVALEWIPRIPHNKLQQHQNRALASGLSDYTVKEKSNTGDFIAVQARPYYYPVYLAEPAGNNIAVQGYDIGSNPDRLSALFKAMENNTTVATVPLTLLQNKLPYDGFLVLKPVYHMAKPIDTVEQRVKNLKGFIVAVFSTTELIQSAFEFIDQPNNTIALNDITEPITYNAKHNLFDNVNNTLTRSSILPIADHSWKLTVQLPESSIYSNIFIHPIFAFIIGLCLTASIVFYIYIVSSNIIRFKQKIVEQTSDQQRNEQLQRSIVSTVSSAVMTVNAKGIIEMINLAAENMFGYQAKEVVGKNISIFVPNPHHDIHDQYISQYIRTGKSNIVGNKRSVQGRHKLGHTIPLEMSITEINSRSQPFFCVVAEDMSSRIEAEKLSTRFLEITKISPDFIATFDTEGSLIFANDPARKALGCSANEDISSRRLDNIFPSAANGFFQKSKRYPDYLHSWIGESMFVTAQNRAKAVSLLLLSHPCHNKEPQYYTVFMRDIATDAKETQLDVGGATHVTQNISDSQPSAPTAEADIIVCNNTTIDSRILIGLKETMSNSEYNNLLPRYVSDTEKNIEIMCTACKEQHYQEIEKLAHQIKASSETIGIVNLSSLADTLEHDIQDNHLEKISAHISNIQTEFSLVKDHLRSEYIEQHKAG